MILDSENYNTGVLASCRFSDISIIDGKVCVRLPEANYIYLDPEEFDAFVRMVIAAWRTARYL